MEEVSPASKLHVYQVELAHSEVVDVETFLNDTLLSYPC